MSTSRHLRVEETPPPKPAEPVPMPVAVPRAAPDTHDIGYWRAQAVSAGERLAYAEAQLKDLRQAADDARARFGKYKGRLDSSQARLNELQSQLIAVSAENAAMRTQLASQETLARKVHDYRESLLHGPIWDLFVELHVSQPEAGVGKKNG